MNNTNKIFLILSAVALVAFVLLTLLGQGAGIKYLLVISLGLFALFVNNHPKFKRFSFTIWVFVFVAWSLFYPATFGSWFGIDLKIFIVPLIQIIMFGMGTTLNLSDFTRVIKMPYPVFIGIILQFAIMPITGLLLALIFNFEPEVAAGIVLVGSCPGGVASNLMTYLAGANVALSVTMTSCSTLLSPVMTPFLMKTLAGKFVPIHFLTMMLSILNMIIVPIIAGVIANKILYSKKEWAHKSTALVGITLLSFVLSFVAFSIQPSQWGIFGTIRNGAILGFALVGVVALAKLIISVWLKGPENWMDKALPIVSMSGIVFIIAIITARSSEKLMSIGLLLIITAIAHNFVGYLLGYWLSRAARLDERSCRTVAFEVGMQNGGMATGLAMTVLNSAKAALAPAIFGPWMNVSGSTLATFWHRTQDKSE